MDPPPQTHANTAVPSPSFNPSSVPLSSYLSALATPAFIFAHPSKGPPESVKEKPPWSRTALADGTAGRDPLEEAGAAPVWSNPSGLSLMETEGVGPERLQMGAMSGLDQLFAEISSGSRQSSSLSRPPCRLSLATYNVAVTFINSSPSPHFDLVICILSPILHASFSALDRFPSEEAAPVLDPRNNFNPLHKSTSPTISSSSSSESAATARFATSPSATSDSECDFLSPQSLSPLSSHPGLTPLGRFDSSASFFPHIPPSPLPSANVHDAFHIASTTESPVAPSLPRAQSLGDYSNGLLSPPATHKRTRSFVDHSSTASQSDTGKRTTLAPPKVPFVSTALLLETFDWAGTPLGPRASWPQSLKSAVSIVMSMTTQGCLWWQVKGTDEWRLIYNDAYAIMSEKKHPRLFGQTAEIGWSEVYELNLKPMLFSYKANHRENDLFLLQRGLDQKDEEAFFTWSYVPVQTEDGTPGGMFNSCYETTSAVLAERRLQVLRNLAQSSFTAKTSEDLVESIVDSLKENPKDLPFFMIYHGSDEARTQNDGSTANPSLRLTLVASIGVPSHHPSAPSSLILDTIAPASSVQQTTGGSSHPTVLRDVLDPSAVSGAEGSGTLSLQPDPRSLRSDSTFTDSQSSTATYTHGGSRSETRCRDESTMKDFVFPVAEAIAKRRPILVDCSELVAGFELRAWNELPSLALVIPIKDEEEGSEQRSQRSQMVLIVGLNVCRPFDDDYRSWIRLLKLQISSALSSVASYSATVNRAKELAQLDRAKSQFFSNVSHELRTPLTLIAGPIQDLLANPDKTDRKGLLKVASRNITRLSRLVDTLMDVSKVEAGKLDGNFVRRDLASDTANLASLFRSAIEAGGIEYIVKCEPDAPDVYVDPDLWEKIVLNLLSNAYKYCLSGSIRVSASYTQSAFLFSVKDSGVGIPKADLGHVTSRFHRVESHGRSFEGTGIGLNLVSELVNIHGGRLDIASATAEESEVHGSTFLVSIPLGRSHLPPSRVREDGDPKDQLVVKHTPGVVQEMETWTYSRDTGSSSTRTSISARSGSIDSGSESDPTRIDLNTTLFFEPEDLVFVVDDNQDLRHYIASILSQYCQVQEACDGQHALEVIKKGQLRPDLIISDVMMPNMDGPAFLNALRTSDSELALCPVIFVSARSTADDRVESILLGADDMLAKPFSSKELVARSHLQVQLGKRRIELERSYKLRTKDIEMRAVEAEERRAQAEEQRRQQELLMDVTSHEIRNPISAILQNAGLCKDNLNNLYTELSAALDQSESGGLQPTASLIKMMEEDLEGLDAIVTMGLSMERIANDVLSLARIQLSTLDVFRVEMDLQKECKRICSVFQNECRLRQIHLQLDFGPTLEALLAQGRMKVLTDAVRLNQVWVNLLSNSIRFTASSPKREIHMSVDLRRRPPVDGSCLPPKTDAPHDVSDFTPGEDCWLFGSISDTGPGLTSEELGKLFKKFIQASSETHARFGGSGLGLYVARAICELMDGAIEVASEKGEGSTFRFYIKIGLPDRIPDAEPSPEILASAVAIPVIPNRALDVLIVEDNIVNQKVLVRQLTKAGFLTNVASDGLEALEALQAKTERGERYNVVLMDIEMPNLDGISCIREVRRREEAGELNPRNLVFALTGNARDKQISQALQAGMDDVFIKPYKLGVLLDRLRQIDN